MAADLWGWFKSYAAQAQAEGDPLKQRLVAIFFEGNQMQRYLGSPQQAIRAYEEGVKLAQRLGEPCWELFYEHQISETIIYGQHDYETGRDHAVKVATRAYKDAYQPCPVRASVFHTLVYVYGAIDSLGYEDKMLDMLDYMEREIPLDRETRARNQYIRVLLAYDRHDYEACERECQVYMSMVENDPTRQVYNMLMGIAYARGNLREAAQYARHYAEWGMRYGLSSVIAHARLNLAVFEQYLGEPEQAAQHIAQGKAHYQQSNQERDPSYYDTVCQYHELIGEERLALRLREEQLAAIPRSVGIDQRFYPQLQYCLLRGRLGLDLADALRAAEAIARESVKPERHLEKVEQIRGGAYHQYEWQQRQ